VSFGHGLVIGKFYPPHRGHHLLIEQAAERCARLTVLAMAARGETVALADRVVWLRATHADDPRITVIGVPCDAPVEPESAPVWMAQETAIRVAVRNFSSLPVDAVFTSESYGDELAARLAAEHVSFDPDRTRVPISATRVRADLAGCWDQLAEATRAGLTTRVVVVGAESTGTTTVTERLAEHYRGRWPRTQLVSEYGREYTETKWALARTEAREQGLAEPGLAEVEWGQADFDLIAAEQTRREQAAARAGSPLLVCDTDAFATMVWERRYLSDATRPAQPWATTELPRRDVYLLTSHVDVPWHDDGLREGDLAVRAAMTDWFADALTLAGHSWVLLTGDLHERVDLAVGVTDYLLAERARFGQPIG
jgi:NadR type nicotinamide-nucleotide adenylyltransferase